jgi:sigma-B regulation protein RsbU (phosphoserine phosphatase)
MKLRTAFLAGFLGLSAAVVAGTAVVVTVVIDQSTRAQLEEDLVDSRVVVERIHRQQQKQNRDKARVIANEPRLRAVIDSDDTDRATVLDVARTLKKEADAGLFLVADGEGFLRADVLHPEDEGFDLRGLPVIAAALADGHASSVWSLPGVVYQVAAIRMDFGARVSGVLATGRAIDDSWAREIYEQTRAALVVELDGQVVAAAGFDEVSKQELGRAIAGLDEKSFEPVEITMGDTTYLALGGVFGDYTGDKHIRFGVMRDLDRALAPSRRVKRILFGVLAGAVVVAILLAVFLSRRLTRPLTELVAFTREVGAGDLSRRASVRGVHEVRTLGDAMNKMLVELDESRQQLSEKERLENELDIAQRIQTSILPRALRLDGLDIAARMVPADEVGGDYYDVLRAGDGGWIGIGDVSGHGLTAGLVMLMAQTGVATLVAQDPDRTPAQAITLLNQVMFDNVNERMAAERHATMTLLRYHRDGRLRWAGAHMDIVVLRHGAQACELQETNGTWLAIVDDVSAVTVDTELALADGDLVVLYTDGVTEARAADGTQFGLERLCRVVEAERGGNVSAVLDAIFAAAGAAGGPQEDDMTALVMRYRSGPS